MTICQTVSTPLHGTSRLTSSRVIATITSDAFTLSVQDVSLCKTDLELAMYPHSRAPSGVGDKPFATFVRYTKHGHGDVSGTMTSWISSGSPEDIQYVIVYLKF